MQPSRMESQPESTAAPAEAPPAEETGAAAEEEDPPQEAGGDDDDEGDESNDALISKAQALMDKITANAENPNPNTLHALSSILEFEESSYMKDVSCPSPNGRSSHNIGRLGNLIRENDEFFELISSKFLSERRYSMSVQAAATRLLFSCSLTFVYPHVFEETVLDNLKSWAMEETCKYGDDLYWRNESGEQSSDSEMLKTFSTGLIAVCLTSGSQVVEDVLTPGLPAKLMRYLRIRILGETNVAQRDSTSIVESKAATTSIRTREEGKGRLRQVPESSYLDTPVLSKDGLVDEQMAERDRDRDRIFSRHADGDEHWIDEEPSDMMPVDINIDVVETESEDKSHIRDLHDGKSKQSVRSVREEDVDDSSRDDSARHKTSRGCARSRVRPRATEAAMENELALTPASSGNRMGGHARSRNLARNYDGRKIMESKQNIERNSADVHGMERDDNDDCFQDCKFGSKDITGLVKKAVAAAEAEAKAANAPIEAIRAAGDAAAEVVKSAALEEFKKANDEEAAIVAASRAASTVVDAAIAVKAARNVTSANDSQEPKPTEKISEEVDDFFILDSFSLAKLREKFCIQCLAILGEYVEVLGPVLHEKGVDVCLALLQQNFNDKDEYEVSQLLPDVLKLIWSLAAHRKFAAVFVDRGGMQKLLTVPRVSQTYLGLSSCLFTIGSIQGIMERVCALPLNIVLQLVELALQLLECSNDQSKKNAALFFAATFVFRAILDAFDAHDGLRKMLNLLQDAASVRSGTSGTITLQLLECSNDQSKKNAALFFAATFVFRAILDAFDAHDGLRKMLNLLQDAASVRSGTSGTISASGSLRTERSPPEVLTSSEKQIAYHTSVALRQYFRAHLLLIVDSIRPSKNVRSAARNIPSVRSAYKPLDISNEAMDAIFRQVQKDRKLGSALVKARWNVVDKFLSSNGHITMLEFCQAAPPVERYLRDLLQYALGVLHIVTLVPNSRKLIVSATLSNGRLGVAVILDAANGAGYGEPEIIEAALNVLINLVCPPPSISNKPSVSSQGQQNAPILHSNGSNMESRDRTAEQVQSSNTSGLVGISTVGTTTSSATQGPHSAVPSGLVGDRRISLGAGAGCAGLAAQLEQCYYQAREAVRANNGIKVLLQLLQPRMVTPPASLDCLRALACRVLLGLARDDTIAHILTKLQVGKKLSELIRDFGNQNSGTEQSKWQAELGQVAIELIGVVTSCGRASTLAASDAATPTLRRIERAAIAAATPISYHARELLLLVHEHLQASGLTETASTLLKEAQLTPLPSLSAPSSLTYQVSGQEISSAQQTQWPSGRAPGGFMLFDNNNKPKAAAGALQDEDVGMKCDASVSYKKKPLVFSSGGRSSLHSKYNNPSEISPVFKSNIARKPYTTPIASPSLEGQMASVAGDTDIQSNKTPTIVLPVKRRSTDIRDSGAPPAKRLNTGDTPFKSPTTFGTPNSARRSGIPPDANLFVTPPPPQPSFSCIKEQQHGRSIGSVLPSGEGDNNLSNDLQASSSNTERLTLDSLVVQYLKHQHRQCPAPITTLPPLSLLQPHVCPEPRHSFDAPTNVTSRLTSREFRSACSGIHGRRKDRQFIYSRFRPWRTCRDDGGVPLTCMTFLGDSSQIAVGSHLGELKIIDSNSNSVLESVASHNNPVTLLQSYISGETTQLMLSSSCQDVQLWNVSTFSAGPQHSFDGCKAARFSNSGTSFAALSADSHQREILLYDVQTCQLELKLSDSVSNVTSGRGHMYSLVHFDPSNDKLLWNGVLWDRRESRPIHRFDEFTDFGGGGFHPSRNEVIINSEIWDLRKYRLLKSVPSLGQTVITFNGSGDVIYAILRRNLEDVTSAVNSRRAKHPLFSAFRTVDAVNYADIATVPVDRCVLDLATERTDSFLGLVTMDDHEEMFSSARVYEVGRRRVTEDDSDPDDADSEEEDDEDDDDDDDDEEGIIELDVDGESEDGDDGSLGGLDDDEEEEEDDDDDNDEGFHRGDDDDDDLDFEGGQGMLGVVSEGYEDEDDDSELEFFGSEDEGNDL
ncbi:unnamed protein product [Cuscuta campestris]|uniref:Uncharacterized protein n=1 Tax=Cuscuta campestris TaxID=132261 RepID=A0A484MD18_9ASTE|nr:unnamed protein product [Cuscuta campestris]